MALSSMSCSMFLHTQQGSSLFASKVGPLVIKRIPSSKLCLHSSTRDDKNATSTNDDKEAEEEEREIRRKTFATLKHFIELNNGSWTGTFTQYDALGNVLACIPTRLKGNVYGKGEHISLYQTLSVKPAKSLTSVSGDKASDSSEWTEYNMEEIDLVTIDRIHRVAYFPEENAYCLAHYNARIPDVVLRAGLLGEDDDELSDIFPGVKLPCRRPALVNESCIVSSSGNTRIRAFHVLDAQGLLDMIGLFHEHKEDVEPAAIREDGALRRIDHMLGKWEGRAVTKRSGLYGFTIGIEKLLLTIDEKDNGEITQTITSTPENRKTTELVLHGESSADVIRFAEGLQTTLLPQGMSVTSPVSVGDCVKQTRSFCLEFGWIDVPGHRRRLIRTYDTSGAVVSTTFAEETRL